MKRVLLSTAVLLAAALPTLPALAADPVVYQSAGNVAYAMPDEPGDYFFDSSNFLGAAFSVDKATTVSAIGGNFTQYGDGKAIFGAIFSLGAGSSSLASATLVKEVNFVPAYGDQSIALSAQLTPGETYVLAFGSGLFGATGNSGLVSGQDTSAASSNGLTGRSFDGGQTIESWDGADVRMVVYGQAAAVPEPSEWMLMLAGGLGLATVVARRRGRV